MENLALNKTKWSIPGNPTPLWANRLGWGLVFATLPILMFIMSLPNYGWIVLLTYSITGSILVFYSAFKTKSKILLVFGVTLLFLYIIVVIFAGVNTP